jgi:hypothetical protein
MLRSACALRFILRVWIALKLWLAASLLHIQAIFSRVNL